MDDIDVRVSRGAAIRIDNTSDEKAVVVMKFGKQGVIAFPLAPGGTFNMAWNTDPIPTIRIQGLSSEPVVTALQVDPNIA